MRRNKILSNIERVQTKVRPEALAGLISPRNSLAAREETRERMAGVADADDVEETGGMRGLAKQVAADAKAAGFRSKKDLTIHFIKNADGEIVGARIV